MFQQQYCTPVSSHLVEQHQLITFTLCQNDDMKTSDIDGHVHPVQWFPEKYRTTVAMHTHYYVHNYIIILCIHAHIINTHHTTH